MTTPPCTACGKSPCACALDLDAVEARAKAATPGPWKMHDEAHWTDMMACGYDFKQAYGDALPDRYYATGPEVLACEQAEADSAFIAHARADVPALVREVRRLREALADNLPEHTSACVGGVADNVTGERPCQRCRFDALLLKKP
jgi:hypothetical protein